MRTRPLGNSGILVSQLCLGTGNFGGTGVFAKTGEIGQQEADAIVGRALEAGINFFNTAEAYSDGRSEEILGKALRGRRNKAIITTKIASIRPGGIKVTLSRQRVAEACEASLRRLGTDYIDLFELHNFDADTPMEEWLGAMGALVQEGKVRAIGCSNLTGWQLMKALALADARSWARPMVIESLYSLLARGVEFELIPLCLDQGVSMVAWSPLHGGFLTGKYRRGQAWPEGTRLATPDDQFVSLDLEKGFKIVEELCSIAKEHDATVPQTALNYTLCKPWITSLIIGVRSIGQLNDNLGSIDWSMTAEELARLDRVSEPPYLYPYGVDNPGQPRL
jgi:aryl-alcohol dehydrogenase-like predicted oxidoreductase